MDNYKKQILQRVIDFYIENSDADKKTIRTVACLMNDIEAINYTRCCTELKGKEAPTFDEWLKKLKWKQIGSSYTFKRGESYTDAESLLISYKKEYYKL